MVGNSGRYSKFQQRLKNIYLSWLKRKMKKNYLQDKFVEDKVKEIRKEFVIESQSKTHKGDFSRKKNLGIESVNDKVISDKVEEIREEFVILDKYNVPIIFKEKKSIRKIGKNKVFVNDNVERKIKTGKNDGVNKVNYFLFKKDNKCNVRYEKKKIVRGNDFKLLKIEIINKLKHKFIEKEAELEVLESELFFISNVIDNSLNYSEVVQLRKRIKEIVDEINTVIEQYNLYNRSYDLENVIGIDDECLVDDLIRCRGLLDSYKDRKKFVKEYKLLDEFKSLYSRLETIKVEVKKVDAANLKVINKYDIRDKKFDQVKLKLLRIKGMNKDYLDELNMQNEYLNVLMEKLSVIDKEESVTSRLVGLDELLFQGLKYIGLKLLSPLSGFIPSIVGETLVTKNMIKGIYNNLHYKEIRHVYYSAIDFDSELNDKLTDVNYTENLVNDTLVDLKRVKKDFLSIYDSNVPGYDDTLKNINKMEEIICKNQYKVKFIKDRLKLSKKINEDKMIKVRKLNGNSS